MGIFIGNSYEYHIPFLIRVVEAYRGDAPLTVTLNRKNRFTAEEHMDLQKCENVFIILSMNPEFREQGNPVEVPPEIRESYIQSISAISPYDETEQKDVEATLHWLKSAEHLNKPHNMEEHLGVFAVVLSQDKKYTFLLNHCKARLWLPPGGHVDLGQKLHECALMETEEELGMKEPKLLAEAPIFLTRTLTQGTNAGHIDVTSWLLIEGDNQSTYEIQAKEASQSGWVNIEELLQTDELSNLHRGFKKMLERGLLGR